MQIGVKDSKLLKKNQREDLYSKIINLVQKYEIALVSPQEIDFAVEGNDNLNLNILEANKSAEILDILNPDQAIIDTPMVNVFKYRDYILKKLKNKKIVLKLENKADVNYPVVSAASILAKVIRDGEIENLKKEVGIDFGSGYLTDSKTVKFLEDNYEKYSNLFRKSWFPYKILNYKKQQKNLFDF